MKKLRCMDPGIFVRTLDIAINKILFDYCVNMFLIMVLFILCVIIFLVAKINFLCSSRSLYIYFEEIVSCLLS